MMDPVKMETLFEREPELRPRYQGATGELVMRWSDEYRCWVWTGPGKSIDVQCPEDAFFRRAALWLAKHHPAQGEGRSYVTQAMQGYGWHDTDPTEALRLACCKVLGVEP